MYIDALISSFDSVAKIGKKYTDKNVVNIKMKVSLFIYYGYFTYSETVC